MLPLRAFILAGGKGKRLRSVVSDRPKPLAMVNDKPFLEVLIESLRRKGIRDMVLLTGYKAESIEDYFSRSKWSYIRFSREESPLGTGGAVKNAEAFAADPTLLVNGDSFVDADVDALLRFHQQKGVGVTLSLVEVEDAGRYGSVIMDEDGFVKGFMEKPAGPGRPGLVNAGLSLLSLNTIRNLPEQRPFSMENEIFPRLAATRQMVGMLQDKPFYDIGTPESYEEFKVFMRTNYQQ
ncbi:MAG: nucleotidyltransferase family protein [Deltaproteobacteria bacterium]|nr:nucleotidyltransferase family protein [Deltaproteobacteria bacterium]